VSASDSTTPELEGNVAIVTGATGGIGQAICHELTQAGASVLVHGNRQQAAADRLANELTVSGGSAHAFCSDLTDPAAAIQVMNIATETFGGVDLVVNNAGVTLGGLGVEQLDVKDWLQVTDINLHSVFYMCQAAIPRLRARGGGAIVNIASNIVNSLPGGSAAYATTKAGVVALTKVLSKEVAHEGIRVNALSPGLIAAGMGQGAIDRRTQEQMTRFLESIPSRRPGDAQEIAAVVRFLCSPGASYLTGQNLTVNGGDRTESYQ
jgi:NAD(P)-dependent dehydrogenase (short-subunit alcohol dehydrogenase family)